MQRSVVVGLVLACALAAGTARAEPPDIGLHALVVGSNAGGPGQTALHYAEDDARRVAATLRELGGYASDAVDVVVHPTPAALRDHLTALGARVAADRAAGRQARVLFYYSGHARSTAIDLGPDELPLGELRQRLFDIPATLTVVVLDACQSGAFSRIKGAQPAADFSFNLRQHLDASGIAVLASSSGSELSQESEQLRSSYFTHHLLVGLRGAGDADHDGEVSIDEAYRYAYHQTLLATAETAVGGQHVSLEVDLKGHGDVPLSFPRAATAAIELPAAVEGQALVEDVRAHAVVAETYKARGAPVRIAVPPGDYRVLIRHAGILARCEVQAAAGAATIELERCSREAIVAAAAKGGELGRRLRFELTGIAGGERRDGFTSTLDAFGYKQRGGLSAGLGLSATLRVERRLWLGGFAALVGSPEWSLPTERAPLRFSWSTTTLGALVRAVQPFGERGLAGHSGLYAQLGAGLGIGSTTLIDQDDVRTSQHFAGWATTMGAGLQVHDDHAMGFSLGYEFDYAPVIDNLTGDTHASGGHRLTAGVSYAY
ncbi:MAG: caspase family protein [Deltaproteobacteria bacterium]|nr:MAG: caspase family protein [Deltaproteobacteria bacterium]TMQ10679.1 MAG: caspase family protein [Deltaproteobacteria bacterium]